MKLKNFKQHSCSFSDPDIVAERERENNIFTKFLNQKVEIGYKYTQDWLSGGGKMKGRITKNNDGNFVFFPLRHTRSYYNVTLGLFDGCHATLTINEINLIK